MSKRSVAVMVVCMVLSWVFTTGLAQNAASAPDNAAYEDAIINLQGDWYFKVYRKYDNMYQYFNYGGVNVTWEDLDAAILPDEATFTTWETVMAPSPDYTTGGLQQMSRKADAEDDRTQLTSDDLFPKWSEAWFIKTIDIPQGFITTDTVTLLLGIIDDLDVVYVNGTPVAASGFITATGEKAPATNVPETGGFTPEGDFRFETSYWEVPREYTINSSVLREGKNVIAVRLYNNNSFGGFYDRTMALVSTVDAVRFLKGQPTERLSDSAPYEAVVRAQQDALMTQDAAAYAVTLSEAFSNNEHDKAGQVAAMQALFDAYENIQITDANAGFYWFDGLPVYSAERVMTGEKEGETLTLFEDNNFLQYFVTEDDAIVERGNMSHSYTVTYTSSLPEMDGRALKYSIYLPPSYYSDTSKSYPVVYLLHGINSTGESFVNVDRIEARMNEWIEEGLITEMIVVMPNSGKRSGYEDREAPDGVNDTQGPWASHIYVDILNEIESNYRVLADARFRGLTGISMGGGGVFKIGLMHTDMYTSFASHMGAVPDLTEYAQALTPEVLPALNFYLDVGIQDQMVNPMASVNAVAYLGSLGANVQFELRDGGHNSAFYMEGMPKSMAMHSKHFIENGLHDY